MPLALTVSLLVFGAVVLTGIVGYLLDESDASHASEEGTKRP
jgi:hypothetical protein